MSIHDTTRTWKLTGDEDDTESTRHGERSRETTPPPLLPAGRLVHVVGAQLGQVHPLRGEPTIIGRGRDAQIHLDGDDVSRHHARISWENDHYVIEDLKSRNGLSVNGLPVQRQELRVGDRIQIAASAILVFALHDELEQRALHLQRLEALGQLASTLVHDFRNILNVIQGNAHFLRDARADRGIDDPDDAQCLADISSAAERGTDLVQRLLYFARRNDPAGWIEVNLSTLVADTVRLVHRTLESAGIVVDLEVAALGPIRGNPEELRHVILNLCLNARDAMPQGGRLLVAGVCRMLDRTEALRRHVRFSGAFYEISISDTGVGMDEATMARVFEPFFTTKPAGRGTGLGLSTAFGVVRNHGGNIFVESRPGEGATFRLLVPAFVASAAPR